MVGRDCTRFYGALRNVRPLSYSCACTCTLNQMDTKSRQLRRHVESAVHTSISSDVDFTGRD
eukprot:4883312-Prymnesium_polylepis.1